MIFSTVVVTKIYAATMWPLSARQSLIPFPNSTENPIQNPRKVKAVAYTFTHIQVQIQINVSVLQIYVELSCELSCWH